MTMWNNAKAERERAERAAIARAVPIENELARRGFDVWLHPRNSNKGAPCPMCGGTDRFSVNVKKQVFNCRVCGAKGDVIDLVRALDGIGYLDAIAYLAGAAPQRTDCSIRKQTEPEAKQLDENAERQRDINAALAVWQRRRPIAGTLRTLSRGTRPSHG
jgi:phage/plasmid primase-like uncharacterized protein